MIRISFLQGFNNGLDGILRAQEKTFHTQSQIASGKRLNSAADDPVAAARIVKIDQEKSQNQQFIANADALENRLQLEESQLKGVTNLLARVREQTVYAANGVLSESERRIIGIEIEGRLDELVNLANTRDTNGEYIFSGYQGGELAFVEDGVGGFNYQGDDGQRLVSIATSTTIAANDSGKDIFVDIKSNQQMFFTQPTATNTGAASITNGEVVDQAVFETSSPYGYEITFNAGNYEVRRYDVTGAVVPAVELTVAATGTSTVIAHDGWNLEVRGSATNGDTFELASASTPKQSMMDTLGKLIKGLNTLSDSPEDKVTLGLLMAESLDNLSTAEENIAGINSKIGARINTLTTVRDVNEGIELVNDKILAEIRDLDYAEAVSRLSQETFTLEAAQQSYAKVSSLSLFRFL